MRLAPLRWRVVDAILLVMTKTAGSTPQNLSMKRLVVRYRQALDAEMNLDAAWRAAIDAGWSDAAIAAALDMTRQAARSRRITLSRS